MLSQRAMADKPDSVAVRPRALLAWYDRHARAMPWRVAPRARRRGVRAEPYHVWLSEIMLQQTTVATVGPYFERFVERWPTVDALAAATLDEVLRAWAGLGYYARARNLHRCAGVVCERLGGEFPADEAALAELPGIGPYTAAAIAAIAFNLRATPLDGNIERVMARLYAVEEPLPAAKRVLREHAEALTPARRPGDFAQALMDLGATVCTPRRPRCLACPWHAGCRGRAAGIAERLPARAPKPVRPLRRGTAFWAVRADGFILLRRRPEDGLLGGMMEVPTSTWRAAADAGDDLAEAPLAADWRRLPGLVTHGFTHFRLELQVVAALVAANARADGVWVPPEELSEHALPTLMKKVVRHVMAHI